VSPATTPSSSCHALAVENVSAEPFVVAIANDLPLCARELTVPVVVIEPGYAIAVATKLPDRVCL
jgi:hypothetical protein